MCLQIPAKVISLKNRKILVAEVDSKRKSVGSLIKVKKGDFVFLKNNFIVGKIPRKEAKEILNLIKN